MDLLLDDGGDVRHLVARSDGLAVRDKPGSKIPRFTVELRADLVDRLTGTPVSRFVVSNP